MKNKIAMVAAGLVTVLAVAGFAGATPKDGGKRLTPPFCIGNTNAGQEAGVVRSVGQGNKCRDYEHRAAGLPVNGPAGPKGADGHNGTNGTNGESGSQGAIGATGATGETGAQGEKGATGARGYTGYTGATGQTGATGETGPAGEDGKDGVDGQGGKDGADGLPGQDGKDGADGRDGQDGGLGNDTLTICLDGHGGINQAPCNGNQVAVEVVIVTPAS